MPPPAFVKNKIFPLIDQYFKDEIDKTEVSILQYLNENTSITTNTIWNKIENIKDHFFILYYYHKALKYFHADKVDYKVNEKIMLLLKPEKLIDHVLIDMKIEIADVIYNKLFDNNLNTAANHGLRKFYTELYKNI